MSVQFQPKENLSWGVNIIFIFDFRSNGHMKSRRGIADDVFGLQEAYFSAHGLVVVSNKGSNRPKLELSVDIPAQRSPPQIQTLRNPTPRKPDPWISNP